MTDSAEVVLKLSADYYAHRVGLRLPASVQTMLIAAIESGINGAQIMDAIDIAVAAYGMGAGARDMLETVRDELRQAWRQSRTLK